ncbi:MAG: acetylornithine deacetylase, partial [Gemmatimonadota bacterium]|nr:acetylornithine deacetylase [Gemmatimonadota bacterium]
MVAGAPGESGCALFLAAVLREWGFEVELLEQVPGRPNLVARTGPAAAPSLMFAGHLDVVG